MKLPLGVQLYLFSNEDNHKQFGLLMRNDSFWRCHREMPYNKTWLTHSYCDSKQKYQKWESFLKESAPPGGFDVHYMLLYMKRKNCSASAAVIHRTSV